MIHKVLLADAEFIPPTPPDSALELMPVTTESFGRDLWKLVLNALTAVQPELYAAAGVCVSLVAVSMLISLVSHSERSKRAVAVCGAVSASVTLLGSARALIRLAAETVTQISQYGKLLLPVLTAAMAAQGGATSSAALYAGTAVFDSVLSSVISNVLVPMVYIYLALVIAGSAIKEPVIGKIKGVVKGGTAWLLKTILYIFTGYMGITGVVSGATDKHILKAAKLTISGMVPVVGGILSDASEAVLVGAELMKNAAGIYGLIAITAIWIAPFLKIGIQYLLLKFTAWICSVMDAKPVSDIAEGFSSAMGLLLAMTGSVCVLQLISAVCFLKGVG